MDKISVKKILHDSEVGKWPYPKLFDALKTAGVEYYDTNVARHEIAYHGRDEHLKTFAPPNFQTLKPADAFNQPELLKALKRVQTGQVTYPTFLKEIAAAGVHEYHVDMNKRLVTYEGADGEEFSERIPPS